MTSWSFSCTDTSPGFDHYLARNTHWPFRWETEVDTIKSIFLLWFPPTLSRFLSALPLSLIILFWTTHPLRLLLRWQTPAAVYAVFGEKHLKAWWANRSVYTEACCVFFTGGVVLQQKLLGCFFSAAAWGSRERVGVYVSWLWLTRVLSFPIVRLSCECHQTYWVRTWTADCKI